jgi:hypothetical protein
MLLGVFVHIKRNVLCLEFLRLQKEDGGPRTMLEAGPPKNEATTLFEATS